MAALMSVKNETTATQSTNSSMTTIIPTHSAGDVNATGIAPLSIEEGMWSMKILAPIFILCFIGVIIIMVYMAIRKRRLDHLRHHLMPLYNFDPAEEGEDWEVELLEDNLDPRNNAYRGYKSMDFPTTENTDLFRR
ncbi:uncharacterized protein C3orf18 homolog [Periplaneta americana]|uniref:uncharacterized protein C3orf18 homolog n=1 Tax=Periplaneta americana TaxID=6978 RepID=UPI0037E9583E